MADLDVKCINTVRVLSCDIVQGANSGHPGAPMGLAPAAHLLWSRFMNYNAKNPNWIARDRFVLSNGHACAMQYSMLHLTGYDLNVDDLKAFRQAGSRCPGHPENFMTAGIEVSTGPLGQGLSNAVGLCIAQANLSKTFDKPDFPIMDHFTYVICGDGCLQEGVTSEACSLAGHLGLGKLVLLYDDNKITIDGSTDLSFTEDVNARFAAYKWHTQTVDDINDLDAMHKAIEAAKAETGAPSIIKIRTKIGHGSSKEGSHKVHGSPLGPEVLAEYKTAMGLDPEKSYYVPDDVAEYYAKVSAEGAVKEAAWNEMFAAYTAKYPAEAAEFGRRTEGKLPEGWEAALPTYKVGDADMATRKWSQLALEKVAGVLPELIGGSADLTPSNLTGVMGSDFQKGTEGGRYLRFGVREHAMSSICNGICAHSAMLVPFCATFLNFMGYATGASRLSALSRFGVIYIMTHDSIGLGEDGPTHQPVEMIAWMRTMPDMLLFRPCDGNEVSGCYAAALNSRDRPSTLCFSRSGMPIQEGTSIAAVAKGAYTLYELGSEAEPAVSAGQPEPEEAKKARADGAGIDLVVVSTGCELQIAVAGAKLLEGVRVRIVSMPCWELFEEQTEEYKLSVFPEGVPVLSVEATISMTWDRYSHLHVGVDRYGASGPYKAIFAAFGFTPENVAAQATNLLAHYKGKQVPCLITKPKSTFTVTLGH